MQLSILKRIAIPFLLIGLLTRCSPDHPPLPKGWEDDYVAHLELDRSTLIATTVADSLEIPWELTWGPDDYLWFTEQNGAVHRLDPESGEQKVVLRLKDVHFQKSRGLLGMAVHAGSGQEPYVFLHYTVALTDSTYNLRISSKLVRYTYRNDTLLDPLVLLDSIPGNTYHNGSRLLVADGKLFFGMGDAGEAEGPQNTRSLTGKILRLNLDGSIPADNPIFGSPVWSWGHRNPQGLVWVNGKLYESEHGPATDDEVNLIEPGRNYGWPLVHGFCDKENEKEVCRDSNVVEPLKAWTPTIATAGLDYYNNGAISEWGRSLLVTNLKGQALRVLRLNRAGNAIKEEHIFFQKKLGRLREVCVSPSGDVYLATSNRDWHPRFQPFLYDTATLVRPGDDRIIRLRRAHAAEIAVLEQITRSLALREDAKAETMPDENWNLQADGKSLSLGAQVYTINCAPCHRPDGTGVEGQIPPLAGTDWVNGSKDRLIALVMRGLSTPIDVNGIEYHQEMPAYAVLDDEEIAAVLTYIRQSWGNQAGTVIAGEVAEERKMLKRGK